MKIDIKKLEKLLKLKTHGSIINDLTKVADGYDIYEQTGFCIFTPTAMGDKEIIPCIVSHTDTVSDKKPKFISNINGVLSNPNGVLGADDRAGVYCIYEMMKMNVNAIFILTDLEECGGIGASECGMDDYFQELAETNISALIELDRENSDHCATYGYDNAELIDIFKEKGGYKEEFGSYTDVATLSNETDLACVNLSVGYYNQHTRKEYLVLEELRATLNFVIDLPKELYGTKFEAEENYNYRGGIDDYMKEVGEYEAVCCDICSSHSTLFKYDNIQVCEDCIEWYDDYKEVI